MCLNGGKMNFLKEWWINNFWMTCDGCNKKMKWYSLQALVQTKEGLRDRFYCNRCAKPFLDMYVCEDLKC